jgi:hypothetical protein
VSLLLCSQSSVIVLFRMVAALACLYMRPRLSRAHLRLELAAGSKQPELLQLGSRQSGTGSEQGMELRVRLETDQKARNRGELLEIGSEQARNRDHFYL